MAIIVVIGLELDNKCMPNEINAVGMHVDIYMHVYVICVLVRFGFSSWF